MQAGERAQLQVVSKISRVRGGNKSFYRFPLLLLLLLAMLTLFSYATASGNFAPVCGLLRNFLH